MQTNFLHCVQKSDVQMSLQQKFHYPFFVASRHVSLFLTLFKNFS